MGHYWSEMREAPTELEAAQERARILAIKLRKLPASRFSVDELALLLRCDWSSFKENYYSNECHEIESLAEREGVS